MHDGIRNHLKSLHISVFRGYVSFNTVPLPLSLVMQRQILELRVLPHH